MQSLSAIDLLQRGDVIATLRANLTSSDLEWAQFQALFEEFWDRRRPDCCEPSEPPPGPSEPAGKAEEARREQSLSERPADPGLEEQPAHPAGRTYSPVSGVRKKDFSGFDQADIQVARLALKKMLEPFRLQVTRRSRRSRRAGCLDFPRSLRKSLATEGLPLELLYKAKRRRLKRLVVLADVSGSMDRYARFVMPFLLGLRGVGSRAQVFVFSTSLTCVTNSLRHLSLERILERIAREVPDWSGGTRIGHSLQQFNQGEGRKLLNRRTVVIVLSDGWDLGGRELLRREMATLSARAHQVIWLNPLAGEASYQPVCQGMRIALPYVDHFLPANSLESLKRVGRLLSRIMVQTPSPGRVPARLH